MSKVMVVTSGKGGVGKTTTSASLGAALAQAGQNVVVVDFDVGLRNLDLVMGAERRVVFDLVNVVQGDAKLAQALIRDKRLDTLTLLPASQTRDKDALTEAGVGRVIDDLREKFDWIICDSPAGIEKGAALAMRFADLAVVVANAEVSSVRDSDRIIGLLDSRTLRAERGEPMEKHLLLTRYDAQRAARGEMMKVEDVLEILAIPLLGVVRESPDVLTASNVGCPVTLHNANSPAARAYVEAAGRLLGQKIFVARPAERRGFMSRPVPPGRRVKLLAFLTRPRPAPPSSGMARERLQVLLAHERSHASRAGLVAVLQQEILAVIARHIAIDREQVTVRLEQGDQVSTLEIDIQVPQAVLARV